MQGKLQQKKQVINRYRLSVRKAEQEIVELNESQLKFNTLRVGQIREMTCWIKKHQIKRITSEFCNQSLIRSNGLGAYSPGDHL
jgi:hypothetical protein